MSMSELNQDTIVKGFMVYQTLKEIFQDRLRPEFSEGFILHILLAVHRIIYNKQYQETATVTLSQKVVYQIESVFNKYDLAINKNEISAMTEYLDIGRG